MEATPNQLVREIKEKDKAVRGNLLPLAIQSHTAISEFHGKIIQELETLQKGMNDVLNNIKNKEQECAINLSALQQQEKKEGKQREKRQGFLNSKDMEIKNKIKNIEAVSAGIKECVSKIKPQKLAKLPVQKDSKLTSLFEILFSTLYSEEKSGFNWDKFRKLVLLHENGQDFIFRLVSFNFKGLQEDQYDKLLKLKNDPQFDNLCVNTQYSYQVIDLADWIQYVCVGKKFSDQKAAAEKQYNKIRKDCKNKENTGFQRTQNFWKQTSTELNIYQNNLESINSSITNIPIGMKKSLSDIKEVSTKLGETIQTINSI